MSSVRAGGLLWLSREVTRKLDVMSSIPGVGYTFFTPICCKKCLFVWKRSRIKAKYIYYVYLSSTSPTALGTSCCWCNIGTRHPMLVGQFLVSFTQLWIYQNLFSVNMLSASAMQIDQMCGSSNGVHAVAHNFWSTHSLVNPDGCRAIL